MCHAHFGGCTFHVLSFLEVSQIVVHEVPTSSCYCFVSNIGKVMHLKYHCVP